MMPRLNIQEGDVTAQDDAKVVYIIRHYGVDLVQHKSH